MTMYGDSQDINVLIGKTITEITGGVGDDVMHIFCEDGTKYQMIHHQDCCESCDIEDITGDLADLIGSPIVDAREETNSDNPKVQEYPDDSFTWTYYIIQSGKGAV